MLDDAVLAVLDAVTWEIDGFALATGYDDTEGRYTGLVLPHQGTLGVVTDDVLLVDPAVADQQRREERFTNDANAVGAEEEVTVTETGGGAWNLTGGGTSRPTAERRPTQFLARTTIDPERYGREFTKLQQEVIAQLLAAEETELEITVSLKATRPDGFTDSTVRTVSENATVLRFERADFT